jgi:hypothetical protein
MNKKHLLLCVLAFAVSTANAAVPASKEWVMQQIAASLAPVTAADWNALCTSGLPTSATGCYGNIASAAFTKINNAIGGFTRTANINPVSAANSLFVKAFLGGTNVPVSNSTISVSVTSGAARCIIFTQQAFAIGPGGVNSSSPSSGAETGAFVPPTALTIEAINTDTTTLAYNQAPFSSPTVGGSPNTDPLYLLCVGYSATDGTTASPITVTAS